MRRSRNRLGKMPDGCNREQEFVTTGDGQMIVRKWTPLPVNSAFATFPDNGTIFVSEKMSVSRFLPKAI